jgi:hypothetical protein
MTMSPEKMRDVFTPIEFGKPEERRPGEKTKSKWVRVGIGFVNDDGSISLRLDATPVNGRLIVAKDFRRVEASTRRDALAPVAGAAGDPDPFGSPCEAPASLRSIFRGHGDAQVAP